MALFYLVSTYLALYPESTRLTMKALMRLSPAFQDGLNLSAVNQIDEFSTDSTPALRARVLSLENTVSTLTKLVVRDPARNLASLGNHAKIIPQYTTPTHGAEPLSRWHRVRDTFTEAAVPVTAILEDDFDSGRCWKMQGAVGSIGILLDQPALISSVTVSHERPDYVSDKELRTAPRRFTVWALLESDALIQAQSAFTFHQIDSLELLQRGSRPTFISPSSRFIHIHDFHFYPDNDNPSQTFEISSAVRSRISTSVVVIQITANSGDPSMTTVCHIGIHGATLEQ